MLSFKKFIYIFLIMFSFLNKANGEYNKIFFDFNINDIYEEKLELSFFKGKTILPNFM